MKESDGLRPLTRVDQQRQMIQKSRMNSGPHGKQPQKSKFVGAVQLSLQRNIERRKREAIEREKEELRLKLLAEMPIETSMTERVLNDEPQVAKQEAED